MIKSFGAIDFKIINRNDVHRHCMKKQTDILCFASAFVRPLKIPFPIFLSYIKPTLKYMVVGY